MAKIIGLLLIALTCGVLPLGAAAQAQVLGPDAEACHAGARGPAVLVHVQGFKDRAGRVRLQYYTDKPDEYLASGKYLRRVELPVTASGDMAICITLPSPGRYAFVVLHDRDSDGRLSIWSDGIGFSRNPRLGFAKPASTSTVVECGPGVEVMNIVLNYRRGLSVRPVEG